MKENNVDDDDDVITAVSVYYLSKGMAHTSRLVPLGNFVEVTLNQGFRSKSYWTKFLVQTIYSLSGIFWQKFDPQSAFW